MSDLKRYLNDLGKQAKGTPPPNGDREPIGQVYNEIQIQRVQKLLNASNWTLSFPEDFELDFQNYYASRFFKQMRVVSLFGLIILIAFSILNQVLIKEHVTVMEVLDFQHVAPIIGIGLLLLLMQNFQRYYQMTLFIFTLSIGIGLVVMIQLSSHNLEIVYFMAIMLLQVYAFTFMRLRFWSALWCSASLFIVFAASFFFVEVMVSRHAIIFSFFYLAMSGISLAANYVMEHYVRRNYLQHRMLLFQAETLGMINYKLQNECEIDGLTGIYNRTKFNKTLPVEWQRAKRTNGNVAILMIDIDGFKEYNDNYGHQMGDEVIRQVANVLKNTCRRAGDLPVRYGGDEFVILLPDTLKEGASEIAEAIHKAVLGLQIPHMYSEYFQVVTVSIGLAVSQTKDHEKEDNPSLVLKLADSALYKAKNLGRNRVEAF